MLRLGNISCLPSFKRKRKTFIIQGNECEGNLSNIYHIHYYSLLTKAYQTQLQCDRLVVVTFLRLWITAKNNSSCETVIRVNKIQNK